MTIILNKTYEHYRDEADTKELLKAIRKIAKDKSIRVLMEDQIDWLERKLKDIAEFANFALKKL